MLDEIEKICSDVAIIKNGTLLASGKVSEILGDDYLYILQAEDMTKLKSALGKIEATTNIDNDVNHYSVGFSEDISPAKLNKMMFDEGVTLTHLEKRQKNLEKQFLELTK
jgi:ABC-2 type transport system ATP-binding protein